MTPYFEQDGIAIYKGDCLDVLRTIDIGPVDCVLTDPPYASGTRKEVSKGSSGSMVRGERFSSRPIKNDQMTTQGFNWLVREAFGLIAPNMVDGASLLSFIDWRQWPNLLGQVETLNFRANNLLVWDKCSMGMGHGFRLQHEMILHASVGKPNIYDRGCPNVLSFKRCKRKDHPSPKPVELLERLLEATTKPGDLVVDPFMGAGSTLEAARNLGRRAVGIESEQEFCDVAVMRLMGVI